MSQKKIKKNFLVISNYGWDISWVPEYTDNYLIYDRSDTPVFPKNIDMTKVIKSPNVGYNSYDYFRFIVDNYDNLPDVTIFAKGHCFPRHVSQVYFDRVMNNDRFTPLMDETQHKPEMPVSYIKDGLYHEINNSWYFNNWGSKYFVNYNDFLRYVYKNPLIPDYVTFAPGGDHIVPRENILKLPKRLYENMMVFMSHCREPVETHMIERACYTLWTSDQEFNETMLTQHIEDFVPIAKKPTPSTKRLARKVLDACMSSSFIPASAKKIVSRMNVRVNSIRSKMANKQLAAAISSEKSSK
jgi:hypothetical protein